MPCINKNKTLKTITELQFDWLFKGLNIYDSRTQVMHIHANASDFTWNLKKFNPLPGSQLIGIIFKISSFLRGKKYDYFMKV